MIIVTGGAGFIGSNLVRGLNKQGREDILVVDNLKNGKKFTNLVDCKIADYMDKNVFLTKILNEEEFAEKIDVVFHQGACSVTTEWDGKYMLKNNYEYSKILLNYCLKRQIPFIYASSAAIYGASTNFEPIPQNEKPLNVYGYSKLLFDQYVRRITPQIKSPVIGFRYFNVYGPHEEHKESMASVMFHFNDQVLAENKIKLFGASHGYADGEQRRDFVYVDDVVLANLFAWENFKSGVHILNLGTSKARSFNDVAKIIQNVYKQRGRSVDLEYVPFPENLKDAYQSFTEANIDPLRNLGFNHEFTTLEDGTFEYLLHLNSTLKN